VRRHGPDFRLHDEIILAVRRAAKPTGAEPFLISAKMTLFDE
jgi:hypothetical protein